MQTAREGAMNGATHIAPMTAAGLLSRSPAVAMTVAAGHGKVALGHGGAGDRAFLQRGVVVANAPNATLR